MLKKIALSLLILLVIGNATALNTSVSHIYTANGTFTVPAGVRNITVELVGGGGGSGGLAANANTGSGSGGGGGAGRLFLNVTPGQVFTITVGAAGAAGANTGTAGGNGQYSRINSSATQYAIAYGGTGGGGGASPTGGTGGGAISNFTNGTFTNYSGGNGKAGNATNGHSGGGGAGPDGPGQNATTSTTEGSSGGAYFGGGGGLATATDLAGTSGRPYGGGAGAAKCDASCTAKAGGAGSAGVVRITYMDNFYNVTFPYVESMTAGRYSGKGQTTITNLPNKITPGSKILIYITTANNDEINITGYTKLLNFTASNIVQQLIAYKTAGTSETAIELSMSQNATPIAYQIYSIANGSTPSAAMANGTSTNANPPGIYPAAADQLWFVAASTSSATLSAIPAQFHNWTPLTPENATGRHLSTARYLARTPGIDPGAFTSGTGTWVASTLVFAYEQQTIPVTNTCTWSGTGNWLIQGTDNCNITTANALNNNNLTINGTGRTTLTGNITGWKKVIIKTGATLWIKTNGRLQP